MAGGALQGLLDELTGRRGWTREQLAKAAGVSEEAIRDLAERPARLTSGNVTLRALSKALEVDAWLLERAAASPRENLHELVRLTDAASGGRLGALRELAGNLVPDSIDEAVRMARQTLSPDRQIELAHLVTLFARLDLVDRQLLLAVATRLASQDLADPGDAGARS